MLCTNCLLRTTYNVLRTTYYLLPTTYYLLPTTYYLLQVMLCTNYEEALDIYERYSENIIGVITDAGFPRNGEHDNRAGMHPSTRAILRLQPCVPAIRVPSLQP